MAGVVGVNATVILGGIAAANVTSAQRQALPQVLAAALAVPGVSAANVTVTSVVAGPLQDPPRRRLLHWPTYTPHRFAAIHAHATLPTGLPQYMQMQHCTRVAVPCCWLLP